MSKINTGRVITGGLLAGLVMNVIDFIVNAVILAKAWADAAKARGVDMASTQATSVFGWIIVDFALGLLLVWLYAGIRSRYGAGPKTAILAGLAVWAIAHLVFASYAFMGMLPWSLVIGATIGGFIAILAAGLAGCWLYRED
jgi:hypothetical protein